MYHTTGIKYTNISESSDKILFEKYTVSSYYCIKIMVYLSPAIIAERKLRKMNKLEKNLDKANGIPPKKDKRTGSRDQKNQKKQDQTNQLK